MKLTGRGLRPARPSIWTQHVSCIRTKRFFFEAHQSQYAAQKKKLKEGLESQKALSKHIPAVQNDVARQKKLKEGPERQKAPSKDIPAVQDDVARKKRPKKGPEPQNAPSKDIPPVQGDGLEEFRECLRTGDVGQLEVHRSLYRPLMSKGRLHAGDVDRLIEVLKRGLKGDPRQDKFIVDFASELALDLQSKRLAATRRTLSDLLSIFRRTKSVEQGTGLWKWWSRQEHYLLDVQAYVEAMKYFNAVGPTGATLRDLEDLYTQAVARLPETFASYSMSPNAIIPHRGQYIKIGTTSTNLLSEMAQARLQHGDIRNAYLDLETTLILSPAGLGPGCYTPFILGRPLEESYSTMQLANRGSLGIYETELNYMLNRLAHRSSGANVEGEIYDLDSQLDAIHGAVALRRPTLVSLDKLLKVATKVLAISHSREGDKSPIIETLQLVLSTVTTHGVELGVRFNEIVSAAGVLQSKELFDIAVSSATRSKHSQNRITFCTIIKAAGMLKDVDMIRMTWTAFAASRTLILQDWITFARATVTAGIPELLAEEFTTREISEDFKKSIEEMLASFKPEKHLLTEAANGGAVVQDPKLLQSLVEVREKIKRICDFINSGQLHNFAAEPLRMTLDPQKLRATEEDMRSVYDKLTKDPREPEAEDDKDEDSASSALSPDKVQVPKTPIMSSGLKLSELRYENWKIFNELLFLATKELPAELEDAKKSISAGDVLLKDQLERLIMWLRGMGSGGTF